MVYLRHGTRYSLAPSKPWCCIARYHPHAALAQHNTTQHTYRTRPRLRCRRHSGPNRPSKTTLTLLRALSRTHDSCTAETTSPGSEATRAGAGGHQDKAGQNAIPPQTYKRNGEEKKKKNGVSDFQEGAHTKLDKRLPPKRHLVCL